MSNSIDTSSVATELLKFAPFQSFVDSVFFHELANRKLNDIKLDETEIHIQGLYSIPLATSKQPSISVSKSSFLQAKTGHTLSTPTELISPGSLMGVNTIEAFKSFDKNSLLKDKVQQVSA